MLKLDELWSQSEERDVDTFADKLLNKIKRNDTSIALDNGYIMPGSRCFIINDLFLTKKEAKEFIKKTLS